MVYLNLGRFKGRIEKLRNKKKSYIAHKIGVDRSYITKLEKGELTPSAEKMLRLAKLLKCPVEDLFECVEEA